MKERKEFIDESKERKRLRRLVYYGLPEMQSEDQFDDLTSLTSKALDMPICLITMIDDDKVWFKSKVGLEYEYVPRALSFCNAVLESENSLVVNNAREDKKFKKSPLVTKSPKFVFYAGIPLTDSEGYIVGTFCVLDRKKRKLNAVQLDILYAMARTTMRLIVQRRNEVELHNLLDSQDNFISNMNHEIRTPLNAILGFNDLLTKTKQTKQQAEYSKIVHDATLKLKDLVRNLLDVSRFEHDSISLYKRVFNLTEIINKVLDRVKVTAQLNGIEVLYNKNNEIFPLLIADSIRIKQLLFSIINCLIRFTENKQVYLDICLEEKLDNKAKLRLCVMDVLDEDKKSKINSDKEDEHIIVAKNNVDIEEICGLDLKIVKQLVKLHDGVLTINEDNEGVLKIEVDLEIDIFENKSNTLNEEKELEKDSRLLEGMHILVVDDSKVNQLLARKILTGSKATVESAENGLVAIKKLSKGDFDAIIMDIQMPKMDGFECTEHIRNYMNEDICIIGCSAHFNESDREYFIRKGMNDVISKPYNSQQLIHKISICRQKPIYKVNGNLFRKTG